MHSTSLLKRADCLVYNSDHYKEYTSNDLEVSLTVVFYPNRRYSMLFADHRMEFYISVRFDGTEIMDREKWNLLGLMQLASIRNNYPKEYKEMYRG